MECAIHTRRRSRSRIPSLWSAIRVSLFPRAHRPSTLSLYPYCPPPLRRRACPHQECSNPLSERPYLLWIARYSIRSNSARTAAPEDAPFLPRTGALTTDVLEK
jgi:hypothetical protein